MNTTDTPAREIIIPDEPVVPDGAWLNTDRCVYPIGAPLVTSAPDADSLEAYNEDEFVSMWHQVYCIFLKIRYLKEADVVFPPEDTGRHASINKVRLRNEFNISERVISLLERLPYLAKGAGGRDGVAFYPEGMILNYLNVDENILESCRDPHPMLGDFKNPRRDYLRPDDVALLYPYESEGMVWILDTKTNAIRTLWGFVEYQDRVVPGDFEEERPGDIYHYRNWPAFHAPFILKRYIRDLWNLNFVPLDNGGFIMDSKYHLHVALLARKIREDYGWPNDFRVDAWEQDAKRMSEAASQMAQELLDSQPDNGEEVLARLERNPEQVPYLFVSGSDV